MNQILQALEQRKRDRIWTPNSLEVKCLDHLDSEENWTKHLGRPRPAPTELQSRAPFKPIFIINLIVFLITTSGAFLFIELGTGGLGSDVKSDLLPGAVVVLLLSGALAGYVANLYRRSWNRRALALQKQEQEDA